MKNARSPFLLALLGLLAVLSTNAQFGPAIQVATDIDYDVHAKIEAIDMDGDDDLDLIFLSNAALVWVNNAALMRVTRITPVKRNSERLRARMQTSLP